MTLNNQEVILRLIESIAACSVIICSFEYITTPSLLSNTGLFSWPVYRLRYKILSHGILAPLLSMLFNRPNIFALLGVQGSFAFFLLIDAFFNIFPAFITFSLVGVIALTLILFALRSPYGKEGADQMLTIIFVVLTFGYAFNTSVIFSVCLWFLSLEACLSYITAGIAKIFSSTWRSGQALPAIMATVGFGHPSFFAWLQAHPIFTKIITWITLCFEILFPFILLAPWWLRGIWLFGGLCFHISNALLMRLNRFVLVFAATYPAIWYCAGMLHGK